MKIEDRILSLVEGYGPEQLDFVIDLCHQNSYSHHKAGVDRVAEMIMGRLNGLLPVHRVSPQERLGNHHVLGTPASASAKSVYLVGHMDTVFPPDHPFQQCRLQGERLLGPGSGDMKGGLAVFVYALKVLDELDRLDRLPLVLILNGDEELGAVSSRDLFLEERERAAACLVAECAGLNNEVVVSRNGKMAVQVEVYGQGCHVGRSSYEKSSAILEAAHKIIALEALNGCLPEVRLNVGKVEGGLGSNAVAAAASFVMDVRWQQQVHRETILSKIEQALAKPCQPGCVCQFEIINSRPAMPDSAGNLELAQLIRQVGRRLGQEIPAEHRRGTSDANFFGAFGVPTLDGLGPVSDGDHTPGEYLEVASLKQRTALLALFLLEYGGKMGWIS
jgi:glutamate carboxypeptidase